MAMIAVIATADDGFDRLSLETETAAAGCSMTEPRLRAAPNDVNGS
jgi:hypothetical protein